MSDYAGRELVLVGKQCVNYGAHLASIHTEADMKSLGGLAALDSLSAVRSRITPTLTQRMEFFKGAIDDDFDGRNKPVA